MANVIWVGIEHFDTFLVTVVVRSPRPVLCGRLSETEHFNKGVIEASRVVESVSNIACKPEWHDLDMGSVVGQAYLMELIRQREPVAEIIHGFPSWDLLKGRSLQELPLDEELEGIRRVLNCLMTSTRAARAVMTPYQQGRYILLAPPFDTAETPFGKSLAGFTKRWLTASIQVWQNLGLTLQCLTPEAWLNERSDSSWKQ